MRIHEIKWWLDEHPEVTHYVAIDDEDLEYDFVPNFVKASTYEGFSLRNFFEARLFLDTYDTEVDKKEHEDQIRFLKMQEVYQINRRGDGNLGIIHEFIDEYFPIEDKE